MDSLSPPPVFEYDSQPYAKVTGGEVLDSDWARFCALAVIKHADSPAAFIYHNPMVYNYCRREEPADELKVCLAAAREEFGSAIAHVLVSGCSFRVKDNAEQQEWCRQRREKLLRFLKEGLLISDKILDVRWGGTGKETHVVYDSGKGDYVMESRPNVTDD
ncbi:MAG: hypothetical protein PHE68_03600 [Candidatus Peribacteraceae bacterium]|nr:hypothetical protein [Candidatus Peribacteraceae bacterium]MDD5074694.1 hypothetical protein [Candidatus Peribacteraceae bacterium]